MFVMKIKKKNIRFLIIIIILLIGLYATYKKKDQVKLYLDFWKTFSRLPEVILELDMYK